VREWKKRPPTPLKRKKIGGEKITSPEALEPRSAGKGGKGPSENKTQLGEQKFCHHEKQGD